MLLEEIMTIFRRWFTLSSNTNRCYLLGSGVLNRSTRQAEVNSARRK
jgi:hypothetical protein